MKILALNSSPRNEKSSKTSQMLEALIHGMRDSGAEVETVFLYKKNIKSCIGCESCTTKTPGKCILNDDMSRELYDKWIKSDLVVYASPIYHSSLNAKMKTFIERTYPNLDPIFKWQKNNVKVSFRQNHPKVVVLSVGAFPEMSNFAPVKAWVQHMFNNTNRFQSLLCSEIYRPMAQGLSFPAFQETAADIISATTQAGKEIVQTGTISEPTLKRISQPFTDDLAGYYSMVNCVRKTCLANKITSDELGKKGVVPRPDSLDTFESMTKFRYLGKKDKSMNGKIKFNFNDSETPDCVFIFKDGRFMCDRSTDLKADLTIETSFKNWVDIMTHTIDASSLASKNKLKISGKKEMLSLLQ